MGRDVPAGRLYKEMFYDKKRKNTLLKALFAEANKLGIDQETLRKDIAPGVIGKRLSKARPQEVSRVLDHLRGKSPKLVPECLGRGSEWKRYESSRAGLLEEIKDLAIKRFGQDYVVKLNNLCARFGESDGYRKMRINALKELKRRLKELNRDDPWEISSPLPPPEGDSCPPLAGV